MQSVGPQTGEDDSFFPLFTSTPLPQISSRDFNCHSRPTRSHAARINHATATLGRLKRRLLNCNLLDRHDTSRLAAHEVVHRAFGRASCALCRADVVILHSASRARNAENAIAPRVFESSKLFPLILKTLVESVLDRR